MAQTPSVGRLLLGGLYLCIAVAILVAAMFAVPSKKISQQSSHEPASSSVLLGGQEIFVEIVDTPALQERGLSFREKLDTDTGMLFIFADAQPYGFWMKDMRFPLDIIYFDQKRKIVDVWEHADPASYPKVFTPRASAQFVLEVSAGFFAEHHLKTGNTFELVR
ncbi:MAG: DUF192 domain-containing protein [Candidatus Yonathbacteria bacterium]|nr:DUF192 domain-containing protein [Candidatus Yonathbacteria bacterium]